jgi:hypothetical protein
VAREDKLARRQRRASGSSPSSAAGRELDGLGVAAEGVRRRTYERLCAELTEVQEDGEAVFAAEALRRFGVVV